MNPAELWQNVARTLFFGFLVGVVFTILFMIASYSIVDTNLRASILEERFMNYFEQHPTESPLTMTQEQFKALITSYDSTATAKDQTGFRVLILETPVLNFENLTIKIPANQDLYPLSYDPSGLLKDWLPATTQSDKSLKINYVSSITYRVYYDAKTQKTYLLKFQFIGK